MKIFTSYFARASTHPQAVAISNTSPPGFRGRQYLTLAPAWEWVTRFKDGKMTEAEFTQAYRDVVLAPLNPLKVMEVLGDGAVLLCWEGADKFCHRRIVGEWLVNNVPDLVWGEL